MIYLDHAATSWPKPLAVHSAVARAMLDCGNPGRGGHPLAITAGQAVLEARESVAALLGIPDPRCLAFTKNCTEAVNLALHGVLRPGDRVAVTTVEHNAVMRPLRELERRIGIRVEPLPALPDGTVDLHEIGARQALAGARLVVACHASNVLGTLQPISELGVLARRAGALFLVDAAQTVGALPLSLADLPVDLVAFPGHKALLGPQGTGGLYIRPGLELSPFLAGGTGSNSESEEMPSYAPDRYEAGTPNVPGLAGLAAAAQYLSEIGVSSVRTHERSLSAMMLEGFARAPKVRVLGPADPERRCGLVSITMEGVSPDLLAHVLQEKFGICTRAGLHCAPAAHRHAGTWPDGAVRFGFGYSTTLQEVEATVSAVTELAARLG